MNELTYAQYKEYIKRIKDLEVSCYQQRQLIDGLHEKSRLLKHEIYDLQHSTTNNKPIKPFGAVANFILTLLLCMVLALFGALLGAIIGIVIYCLHNLISYTHSHGLGTGIAYAILWLFKFSALFPFAKWGGIIGYGLSFIFLLLWNGNNNKENAADRKRYPRLIAQYEKDQQKKALTLERLQRQLNDGIPRTIASSERQYNETKAVLQKYYDLNVIYPKYRGLVPICTIYEYLESGRCFSLQGHEGAYNLYENELRMNLILGRLDEVIYHLDDISQNQRLLAAEIKTSNAKIDSIFQTLNKIDENTRLTQYYSSVSAVNSSYLAWLAYKDHKPSIV